MIYNNNDFAIIGWPEIQVAMKENDFEKHATLINENDYMGIEACTYLVEADWYLNINNK